MKRNVFLFVFILAVLVTAYGQNASAEITVNGSTLTRKFEWLLSNAESGKTYVIVLDRNETLTNGQNLDYDGREVTIILRGRGAMRRINFNVSATPVSIFMVRSGVTLVLDNLITIQGSIDYSEALVRVGNNGIFIMNNNTAVNGNNDDRGCGVDVTGGTFIMNGGIISGNRRSGIIVSNSGTFTMNGGTVSDNWCYSGGGGVDVDGGTFIMNGGTISGNSSLSAGWPNAGGVCISGGGTFSMTNGNISGNISNGFGTGGILVGGESLTRAGVTGGTFTMNGGTISGNHSRDPKEEMGISFDVFGGVTIYGYGIFNLNSPATKTSISSNYNHRNEPSQVVLMYSEGRNGIFRVNGLSESGY